MKFPLIQTLSIAAAVLTSANLHAQDDIKAFTEPYRSVEIAAAEMGTLAKVAVEEGHEISAGDLLANLNEEVLSASLAVAKNLSQAGGELKSAKAELRMQQKRFEKIVGLQERRHASQTEVDRAKAQLEIAEAKLESVQDDLRAKKLDIERIEAQLEQRRLRSPIDGIVTSIFKEEGEFVSPNDPSVMKVVQLNPLRAIFSVPQDQAFRLMVKETVSLTLEDTEVSGVVEFVSPTADAQSGTCRVKVRIENPKYLLASGLPCYLKGFAASSDKEAKLVRNSSGTLSLKTRKRSDK